MPRGRNRFGTQSPKKGWINGERGNGTWDPAKSGLDDAKVKKIESVTDGKPLTFKDGNPDFSEYTYKTKTADGAMVDGKVEIELSRTGDRDADFKQARSAMAEKLGKTALASPKAGPGTIRKMARPWSWCHPTCITMFRIQAVFP